MVALLAKNLFITGSSGTGKSFLSTAIGYLACKNGIRTLYANTSKLLGMLKVAKAKGTIETELKKGGTAMLITSWRVPRTLPAADFR